MSPVLNEMVTVVVARETTSEKCKLALKLAADRTQVLVCGCCAACVSMFRSCSQ